MLSTIMTDTGSSVFKRHPRLVIACVLVLGLILTDILFANAYKLIYGDTFYNKIVNPASISDRAFRIPSDIYHHDLKKNVRATAIWGPHSYPMITNSLGFRDRENRVVPRHGDKYRIVFMGDSFVEGSGVAYPDSVAGILAQKFAAKYDILNAGVASYAPTIYYRKSRYFIEEYGLRFDEMVLLLDISDISDEVDRYAQYDEHDADKRQPLRSGADQSTAGNSIRLFFQRNSILYAIPRFFKNQRVAASPSADPSKNPVINYWRSTWTIDNAQYAKYGKAGLNKAKANVLNLKKLLDKHRIKMTLVVYPWPAQIYYNDLNSLQVTEWQSLCETSGINFVNLFPEFIGADPGANKKTILDYFIPYDMHWNRQGNLKVAQALERKLPSFSAR